jgi:CheY-like chemotaxis protein
MSNGQTGIEWRFLIVEDQEDMVRQLQEIAPACVDAPDTVKVTVYSTFENAVARLRTDRFDLLILDLKDDSDASLEADSNPAGLAVFEELKRTRFVPVVFYTALAHKVGSEQTSFVRVVEKTEDVTRVREEVRRVLATKLPVLTRRLEELQRSYMWDFVSTHWKDFQQPADQADVAYLLARRLAITLEATAGEFAAKVGGASETPATTAKAHPMVMYVVPSIGPHPRAGDIISETDHGQEVYWLMLTPSCDFAQKKASHFTLAKCERLVEREEFKKWSEKKDDASVQRLGQLIEDKRGDRFKFLPRAFFLPDLVVDLQQLRTLSIDSIGNFKAVATLDSPFAESVVARFSRYFNRLGTPDVDKTIVINRLQSAPARSAPQQESPSKPV